jgi:hypothetical protein
VRLDHLLSKEYHLAAGRQAGITERHSQLVHWRSVLVDVERWRFSSPVRRLELGLRVLSSVLREPPTALQAFRPPLLRCGFFCPLRIAERARASLFYIEKKLVLPSYKEPTVDALASRTDEGRG